MGVIVRHRLAGIAAFLRVSVKSATTGLLAAIFITASLTAANANSKYSGIVIDAKTGRTIYENSADTLRYPASLTKMMTLYLLFDAMDSGKVNESTRITFSRHAASQPPTKLGIPAGQSIPVETAIYAMVTRSANDVATAVGEFLGGSESNFARMMTAKARQLGMTRTVFQNANGLPDPDQHTTAHDMARLGMALHDQHAKYFHYFSTRSFVYKGHPIGNHNHLLGRLEGVDGIKTGYIRASGFNIVTTVSRDNRRIVAVVFGGRTARSRDAQMIKLVNTYLPKASTGRDRFLIAENGARAAVASILPDDIPLPTRRPKLPIVNAYADDDTQTAASAIVEPIKKPQPAIDPVRTASTPKSGWAIQVASAPSQSGAQAVLARTAKKAARILADASAFTEEFDMKGTTYYRARFGGFASKSEAWNTCGALKKKSIACYAVER